MYDELELILRVVKNYIDEKLKAQNIQFTSEKYDAENVNEALDEIADAIIELQAEIGGVDASIAALEQTFGIGDTDE